MHTARMLPAPAVHCRMTAERGRENYSPPARFVSPTWPSLENILHELKTVFPNGDFVIEGCVDPREVSREEGPNRSRATATRRTRRQTGIPGQSIAVGPCGPGEHSSKLIRSR